MPDIPTRDEHGRLPDYAWPGGGEILYIVHTHGYRTGEEVLCAKCASQRPARDILAWGIHEEGPPQECEACGWMMISTYGDPYVLDGVDPQGLPEGLTPEQASEAQDREATRQNARDLAWRLRIIRRVLATGEDLRGKTMASAQAEKLRTREVLLSRQLEGWMEDLSAEDQEGIVQILDTPWW